jgi:hypothetical protein
MKIVGELMILSNKYQISDFAIDTIGIGKGIADRLNEMGKHVSFVNSAERADAPDRFYNRRTEMWWYLLERILSKEIDYPQDEELRRQITALRYKVVNSNGQIRLEAKDELKKRIGRSPDRADAFVYGIWALKDSVEYNQYHNVDLGLEGVFSGRAGY